MDSGSAFQNKISHNLPYLELAPQRKKKKLVRNLLTDKGNAATTTQKASYETHGCRF